MGPRRCCRARRLGRAVAATGGPQAGVPQRPRRQHRAAQRRLPGGAAAPRADDVPGTPRSRPTPAAPNADELGMGIHAGLHETSVLLHLRPDLVDMSLAPQRARAAGRQRARALRRRGHVRLAGRRLRARRPHRRPHRRHPRAGQAAVRGRGPASATSWPRCPPSASVARARGGPRGRCCRTGPDASRRCPRLQGDARVDELVGHEVLRRQTGLRLRARRLVDRHRGGRRTRRRGPCRSCRACRRGCWPPACTGAGPRPTPWPAGVVLPAVVVLAHQVEDRGRSVLSGLFT